MNVCIYIYIYTCIERGRENVLLYIAALTSSGRLRRRAGCGVEGMGKGHALRRNRPAQEVDAMVFVEHVLRVCLISCVRYMYDICTYVCIDKYIYIYICIYTYILSYLMWPGFSGPD